MSQGSPFNVFVDYGDEYHGLAYGDGLTAAAAGEIAEFHVQFQDQYANNRTQNAHCVVCTTNLGTGSGRTAPTTTYLGQGLMQVQWFDTVAKEKSTFWVKGYPPGTVNCAGAFKNARGGLDGAVRTKLRQTDDTDSNETFDINKLVETVH